MEEMSHTESKLIQKKEAKDEATGLDIVEDALESLECALITYYSNTGSIDPVQESIDTVNEISKLLAIKGVE